MVSNEVCLTAATIMDLRNTCSDHHLLSHTLILFVLLPTRIICFITLLPGDSYGGFPEQSQVLEEENDHLQDSLREKVKELKVV